MKRKAAERGVGQQINLSQKEVTEFLEKQDIYSKHKPLRRNFLRRRVIAPCANNQLQADLADMRNMPSKGYKYILTVIDVFSKYAHAIPLKSKKPEEVIEAFKTIFSKHEPPKLLQTDNGCEFTGRKFQDYLKTIGVKWFATKNMDIKAPIVERFNRTLKEKMYKCFSSLEGLNKNWVDLLPKLLENYNNSYHSSIKMTPTEAEKPENKNTVIKNLYITPLNSKLTTARSNLTPAKSKFKVGDNVRLSKIKSVFDKGYLPNYTNEIFTINKVFNTFPVTYEVRDQNDEILEGKFYNEELAKVLFV